MLQFSVSDTGIGIAEEKPGSHFRKFPAGGRQHHAAIRRHRPWTFDYQEICRNDGGPDLGRKPGRPGQYFSFYRPAQDVPDPQALPLWAMRAGDMQGKRVLIVDDNATNRRIFREMVLSWGMDCEETVDGTAVCEILQKALAAGRPFDLMLLDLEMPVMDGFETGRSGSQRQYLAGFGDLAADLLRAQGGRCPLPSHRHFRLPGETDKKIGTLRNHRPCAGRAKGGADPSCGSADYPPYHPGGPAVQGTQGPVGGRRRHQP